MSILRYPCVFSFTNVRCFRRTLDQELILLKSSISTTFRVRSVRSVRVSIPYPPQLDMSRTIQVPSRCDTPSPDHSVTCTSFCPNVPPPPVYRFPEFKDYSLHLKQDIRICGNFRFLNGFGDRWD